MALPLPIRPLVRPPIRPDNHPFPFLLHLEWVLLAVAVLSELTPVPLPHRTAYPAVALASLLMFGAMGLRLPVKPLGLAVVHIVGQFLLILIATQAGLAGLRLFPFLYLILLIRSCLMVGMAGRLMVLGTSFVLFLGVVQVRLRALSDRIDRLPPWAARRFVPLLMGIQVNLVFLFAVLLVFVLFMVNALLAERQRREELHQANEQLRASAAQIEALALAQERSRIAREIHDSLGHSLTGLNIQLEGALKLWHGNPTQAQAFVQQAKVMGSTALAEVRQAVATVRADPLQGQSLEQAITALTEQFQQATGVTPTVMLTVPPLPASLAATLYRILQEALTNICKHAQASAVTLTLHPSQRQAITGLEVIIQDNGQGFLPGNNQTGFGLQGIQERAQAAGGTLKIKSHPNQGCTLKIWLPMGRRSP